MYSPKQTYQINKSYDEVVANIKQATSNEHPSPIVRLDECDIGGRTGAVFVGISVANEGLFRRKMVGENDLSHCRKHRLTR